MKCSIAVFVCQINKDFVFNEYLNYLEGPLLACEMERGLSFTVDCVYFCKEFD